MKQGRITVSRTTKNKRRRYLHTFEDAGGLWVEQDPFSHAERKALVGEHWVRPPNRRPLSAASTSPRLIDHVVVDFGNGVQVSARILSVVLDALKRAEREHVDIDDIKSVESQCGSLINRMKELPEQDRRHAAELLHATIVERCSTVSS